jgi:putative multiple sugar transport system permease protein
MTGNKTAKVPKRKEITVRNTLGWTIQRYLLTIASVFRTNIRDYGMYIALTTIFITFGAITGWVFLMPVNFTNLLNQTAYVSVLAVGMTLVIVTRQIDLSVGFIGAFLGAFVVVSVENNGWSVIVALLAALAITMVIGLIKGYLVANIKVPSFVVTLAGMFIFRGLLMLQTDNRTVPTRNPFFLELGVGYLPTFNVAGYDLITITIGVLITISVIYFGLRRRTINTSMNIPNEKLEIFITKSLILIAVIAYLTYTFSAFRGISYLLLVTVLIVVVYHFITTKTTLGRRIYAVGGNPEAAELSGINVNRILIIVFISMGIMALVSGVMYASRLQNTSPNHGPFWELYAIAAAFIGGTSASGGVGKVVNAVIGSVVIMSLRNGMALAGVNSNIEPIILGSVLLLAVIFDIFTRNVREIDLVGIHYARIHFKAELDEASKELNKAKSALAEARNAQTQNLLQYEVAVTDAQGIYNRIMDQIRVAKESDFIVKS